VTAIHASVRCSSCDGDGIVALPCRTPGHGHRCDCGSPGNATCEDCDGSGRDRCEVCGEAAIIAVPTDRHPIKLCQQCHADEMADQARNRAEARLTKQLEESK